MVEILAFSSVFATLRKQAGLIAPLRDGVNEAGVFGIISRGLAQLFKSELVSTSSVTEAPSQTESTSCCLANSPQKPRGVTMRRGTLSAISSVLIAGDEHLRLALDRGGDHTLIRGIARATAPVPSDEQPFHDAARKLRSHRLWRGAFAACLPRPFPTPPARSRLPAAPARRVRFETHPHRVLESQRPRRAHWCPGTPS